MERPYLTPDTQLPTTTSALTQSVPAWFPTAGRKFIPCVMSPATRNRVLQNQIVPLRAAIISINPRRRAPCRKVPSPGKTVAFKPRQFRAFSVSARIGGSGTEDVVIGGHRGQQGERKGDKKSDHEENNPQKVQAGQDEKKSEIT